jgi:two-component system, chemotaxis family, response regulator Rcp1
MENDNNTNSIIILLVEDSPSDADLTVEALEEGKILNELHIVGDGIEALQFLRHEEPYADAPRPDLILLDLNLPRKDGKEVLKEIKDDKNLKRIPVIVLTTSAADEDVCITYDSYANCYVTKPVDIDEFIRVLRSMGEFWLRFVKFPHRCDD